MVPSNNAYKCTLSLTHSYLASGVSWFLAELHESSPDELGKAKSNDRNQCRSLKPKSVAPREFHKELTSADQRPKSREKQMRVTDEHDLCSFQGLDKNISKASRSYLAGWRCLTQARSFNFTTSLGALKKHRRQEHCLFSGQRSNPKSKPECPRSPNFQNYPLPPVPT